MIYFDNGATSLIKPQEVKNAVIDALNLYTANPGRSGHIKSQMVAEKIYETRENVKDFFKAKSYDLIFTKNCTEALNLAIFGTLKSGDHVITTTYEHNSVLRPLRQMEKQEVEITILDCDLIDFSHEFESYIKSNTTLVIATAASNVTGEFSNLKEISEICKKHKIKYLIDGAQASGHIPINLEEIDADMYAFAGHKGLLSLTGVGGLIVKNINELKPILYGGTGVDSSNLDQNSDALENFEAGTIPTISILSLNAGINFLRKNFSKIQEKEHNLSGFLYKNLKKLKFLTIYSKEDSKNVFSFNVKNIDSGTVANILNEQFQICVRAGLHCAPLVHKKNGTIDMGMVRVSLDFNNSFEDIEYLIFALTKIANA